ncbi:gluconokinase [Acidomonas methanolica]|uniref:Gluconokinase n=1 Tax=Acidomonas methanolica NBRC 104435 TaxID=1231351 RepID=A0A023D1Q8_ACIMT|nr:gluconokinase [Acidomonas methanolica]MBU2653410.1 gluconokinase [Acidomonas methanolica]TCS32361.1 gluconokinase [Acidomonas methanolica]GAJ27736.1 gluconokinase [Acidomonas methanolica NBRC 104435]GBQ53288.1 gluconokinase [Acidomonas methanolica]GEK97798.1 gluconokinase [Acidomonas methanolica NBRC 104435]
MTPHLLVVMGVSGSGKSTVAMRLAETCGWPFQEGDSLHPPENVEKMHNGIPLNDADRAPWLRRCHQWLADHAGSGGVLSCSALKRVYRETLREGLDVTFVYLHADPGLIHERMEHRPGHFMPATLLSSQLATLEVPGPDENVISLDSTLTPDEISAAVERRLEAEA